MIFLVNPISLNLSFPVCKIVMILLYWTDVRIKAHKIWELGPVSAILQRYNKAVLEEASLPGDVWVGVEKAEVDNMLEGFANKIEEKRMRLREET